MPAMAQDQLARLTAAKGVLTVPIFHGDHDFGAVTLERFSGDAFSEEEADICEGLCAAIGTNPCG